MKNSTTLALLAVTAIAGSAVAGSNTYDGAGGVLNDAGQDNNFNTIPGVTSFDITIGDDAIIRDFQVSLDIDHTWVGDLNITVSNGVDTVTLIDRPGFDGAGFGNPDDLLGKYLFADGGDAFPEVEGTGTVAPGTYAGVDSLSTFNGSNIGGTWTLTITDNAGGDTGSLIGWSIIADVNPVPAPGVLAMLGLAGLATRSRRRG